MEDTLIDIRTGKPPTPQVMDQIKRRAEEIFRNSYASWEQLDWAIAVYPEGIVHAISTARPKHRVG